MIFTNLHLNSIGVQKTPMLFFFIILILFNSPLYSQDCNSSLTLKVIDLHDSSVLQNASIFIKELNKEVKTNSKGEYVFRDLCNKEYLIEISHKDCETIQTEIKIKNNSIKTIRMEHHLNELDEIIVKSNFKSKSKSVFENKVSKQTLEDYSNNSIADVLKTIPGVSTISTGSSIAKPQINGLHSSRVLLINNNVKMEDHEWGIDHAPSIDINSIEKISLIKGAGALKYGGSALGGVIISETLKTKLVDSLYGKLYSSASTNGKGGTITTDITKTNSQGWYTRFQGTFKRFGDYNTSNYIMSNTGLSERNFSLKSGLNRVDYGFEVYYSFFNNETGILRASHLVSAQDIFRGITNGIPLIIEDFTYNIDAPKQKIKHNLAKFNFFKTIDIGKFNFQYDFQSNKRQEFDIRRGDDRDTPSIDLELTTHSLSLDFDSRFSNNLNLNIGIVGKYQKNFPDPETGVRRLIPDYEKYDLGIYSIFDYELNPEWILEGGLRYDYTYMDVYKYYKTSFWESRDYGEEFSDIVVEVFPNQILTNPKLEFNNTSATLGSKFLFDNNNTIFFNYSMSSRSPNPSELFSEGLHHASARIELGDLRFKSEVGHNFGFTYQKSNEKFSLIFNSFLNTINDFIVIEPVEIMQTIRGSFSLWEYRQTDAKLFGFDLNVDYSLNKYINLIHQSSIIKGTDTKFDTPLIDMPPANIKNEIVYSNLDLNNLTISLQSEYTFKQNKYPDNNFEVYIPTTETYEYIDLSTPPKAYHLLNFNSRIDILTDKNKSINLGFKINNLLNTTYKNYLNRLRLYTHDLGRNFILSVKYKL